jgi:hypothetical protein
MKTITRLVSPLAGMLLVLAAVALAEENADDQTDVWAAVENQWNLEEKGDAGWIDELLVDKFSGWGKESPAPRSKTSTRMWDRFNDKQGGIVAHELYPLAIVVEGDVAVAHYLYTSAYQDKDDKVEVDNGRYTDVLVRTPDGWKFLAWHGGDDD